MGLDVSFYKRSKKDGKSHLIYSVRKPYGCPEIFGDLFEYIDISTLMFKDLDIESGKPILEHEYNEIKEKAEKILNSQENYKKINDYTTFNYFMWLKFIVDIDYIFEEHMDFEEYDYYFWWV